MFINRFNADPVSLDDAQFVIALALEETHDPDVFEGIVSYLGFGTLKDNEPSEPLARKREDFHNEVRSYGLGNLKGCIKYFHINRVIKVRASKNSKNYKYVSLADILTNDEVRNLYQICMNILRLYPGKNLIIKYLTTKHCKRAVFAQWKNTYALSADKSRQNVFSNAVLEDIYSEFYTSFSFYNVNRWVCESGTPLKFVRHCLTFFKQNKVYDELNNSGLNVAISHNADGDEVNALTYQSISKSSVPKDFNFLETVKSIYKASVTMFNHNGSDEAYYDIFSYYCDRICEARFESVKAKLRKVYHNYNFKYSDNSTFHQGDQVSVIKTKRSNRCVLCNVFLPIVDKGINPDELLMYYEKVIRADESNLSSTSGIHLFRTDITKANNKLTNSEIFQIMVSGFLALKDLLAYLNSEGSVCTPFEFPTTIFRDPTYIRRFNNIQDYVNYFKQVSVLVEEARCDRKKSAAKSEDGLFSNDKMYDVLVANNYIHNSIITQIMNVPLSDLGGIIDKNSAATKSTVFKNAVYYTMKSFDIIQNRYNNFIEDVNRVDKVTLLKRCIVLSKDVVRNSVAIQCRSEFVVLAASFWSVFAELQRQMDKPIDIGPIKFKKLKNGTTDEYEDVIDSAELLLECCKALVIKEKIKDSKQVTSYAQIYMTFHAAFVAVYNSLMGTQYNRLTVEQFNYLVATLETMRRIVTDVTDAYTKLDEIAPAQLNSKFDTTYLTIAVLYKYKSLFMMSTEETEFESYLKDYLKVNVVDSKYELDYDEFKKYLYGMIVLFKEAFGQSYSDVKIMYKIARSYISERHEHVSEYSVTNEILTRASNERRDYIAISEGSFNKAEILKALRNEFEFDNEGYALRYYERCVIDGFYVLDSGYMIKPVEVMNSYECQEIDEHKLSLIRYESSIRG